MRSLLVGGVGLSLALWTGAAVAQDLNWRPARGALEPAVSLGRPRPLVSDAEILPVAATFAADGGSALQDTPRPLIRGQSPDLPSVNVPPPPPPPGNAAVFPGGPAAIRPGEEAYNCGIVNNNADLGGFWVRTGEKFRRCWTDVTDSVTGIGKRSLFQSDHCFDEFISPVSHPVFFEDPRALTELRPIFIWQHTPNSNYFFSGGNNYFAMLQGRLALTDTVSIVMNKLGWVWVNPDGTAPGAEQGNGFGELHIGPKVTFLRNEATKTVAAIGMNFEIAIGSSSVFQDTGNLSLSPYFSITQNFGCTQYGSFNFMNTTGYSLGIDSERSDNFYTSFHLDFDVGNAHTWYPLVELNWTRYTFNGSARMFNFEGADLFNFGSDTIAGHNDLTLAVGGRYKWSEALQFGLAGEFNIIGGGRHMEGFRLTADMIWRY